MRKCYVGCIYCIFTAFCVIHVFCPAQQIPLRDNKDSLKYFFVTCTVTLDFYYSLICRSSTEGLTSSWLLSYSCRLSDNLTSLSLISDVWLIISINTCDESASALCQLGSAPAATTSMRVSGYERWMDVSKVVLFCPRLKDFQFRKPKIFNKYIYQTNIRIFGDSFNSFQLKD